MVATRSKPSIPDIVSGGAGIGPFCGFRGDLREVFRNSSRLAAFSPFRRYSPPLWSDWGCRDGSTSCRSPRRWSGRSSFQPATLCDFVATERCRPPGVDERAGKRCIAKRDLRGLHRRNGCRFGRSPGWRCPRLHIAGNGAAPAGSSCRNNCSTGSSASAQSHRLASDCAGTRGFGGHRSLAHLERPWRRRRCNPGEPRLGRNASVLVLDIDPAL